MLEALAPLAALAPRAATQHLRRWLPLAVAALTFPTMAVAVTVSLAAPVRAAPHRRGWGARAHRGRGILAVPRRAGVSDAEARVAVARAGLAKTAEVTPLDLAVPAFRCGAAHTRREAEVGTPVGVGHRTQETADREATAKATVGTVPGGLSRLR